MARKPETMLSMQCTNNPFERAIDVCDECGLPFSREFLVYPKGDRRPPFCKACAIAMSGVRHAARRPRMPKKEVRRRREEVHAALSDGRPTTLARALEIPDLPTIDEAERNSRDCRCTRRTQDRMVRLTQLAAVRARVGSRRCHAARPPQASAAHRPPCTPAPGQRTDPRALAVTESTRPPAVVSLPSSSLATPAQ